MKEVGRNYLIWNGSTFEPGLPEKKVIYPNGGNLAYLEAIYTSINYPPKARYNNIEGTVLLEVEVNELGLTQRVRIKSGIGYGCDAEALRVVRMASDAGFQPALKNGKPTRVKFELPVVFRIN